VPGELTRSSSRRSWAGLSSSWSSWWSW
jgi:hypothetical protein